MLEKVQTVAASLFPALESLRYPNRERVLLGECYVDGMMDGKDRKCKIQKMRALS